MRLASCSLSLRVRLSYGTCRDIDTLWFYLTRHLEPTQAAILFCGSAPDPLAHCVLKGPHLFAPLAEPRRVEVSYGRHILRISAGHAGHSAISVLMVSQ